MTETKRFAVCIRNEGNEASLELRKIYEILADAEAESHAMIRAPSSRVQRTWPSCLHVLRTPLVNEALADLAAGKTRPL